jgi:hypothetical protein
VLFAGPERESARPHGHAQVGKSEHVQIPLGVGDLNALLSKQTPDLIEDLALVLCTPFCASTIQKRSSSSIAVSPKAMISALGAGTARTRSG